MSLLDLFRFSRPLSTYNGAPAWQSATPYVEPKEAPAPTPVPDVGVRILRGLVPDGCHRLSVGVQFQKLSTTAKAPAYASPLAAGMDLCADHDASIAIGDHKLILTNIAIKMPPYFEAQVRPRSGLALKKGITVLNTPGTIDADYTGGIGVILYNAGSERFEVRRGDRIAQLVFAPVWRASLTEVDEFQKTKRGAGGFGSTGV